MRIAVCTVAFALFGGVAVAAPTECLPGFSIDGWSATYSRVRDNTMIWMDLQNPTHSDITMVDGQVQVTDALGAVVEPFPMKLEPDMKIPANGGTVAELYPKGENRLTKVDAKLVTVSVCVRGYVAADGSVVKAVR